VKKILILVFVLVCPPAIATAADRINDHQALPAGQLPSVARQARQSGGLVVHVGAKSPDLAIELAASGRFLVHVLADGGNAELIKKAV
jgi:hypothetical protein